MLHVDFFYKMPLSSFFCTSHIDFKKASCRMSNLINIPCHVVYFHSILSLGPMAHVDFKKWPCRHVEFTDREAHPSPHIRTIDIGPSVCICSSLYIFWDLQK